MTAYVWSDEDKKKILELWEAGKTASQIAVEFNGKTRNSIIGLLHRMKAPKREKFMPIMPRPKREPSLRRERPAFFVIRKQSRKEKVAPTTVPPPLSVTSGDGFTLSQLRKNHCRDVIGYRGGNISEPIYCGAEKHLNTSFCEYHKSIYMFPPKRALTAR